MPRGPSYKNVSKRGWEVLYQYRRWVFDAARTDTIYHRSKTILTSAIPASANDNDWPRNENDCPLRGLLTALRIINDHKRQTFHDRCPRRSAIKTILRAPRIRTISTSITMSSATRLPRRSWESNKLSPCFIWLPEPVPDKYQCRLPIILLLLQ